MTVSGLKKGTENDGIRFKKRHGNDGIRFKKRHGNDCIRVKKRHGNDGIRFKKGTEMTVSGLKKGTEMTVSGLKKGTEMTVSGMREGAAASSQVLKDGSKGLINGIAAAEEFLMLDPGDLAKLVPVFLEDAADGNTKSIYQLLQLDSKTEQYSVVIQHDDERRTAMHKAALEGRTEVIRLLVDYVKGKPDLEYLIDSKDVYGSTPFISMHETHKSNPKLAEYLLENGATVDLVKKLL